MGPWQQFDTAGGTIENISFKEYRPENALIRDPESGAIYLLRNGARIHIRDDAEFNALGLSWDDVRPVPAGVAECLPLEQR